MGFEGLGLKLKNQFQQGPDEEDYRNYSNLQDAEKFTQISHSTQQFSRIFSTFLYGGFHKWGIPQYGWFIVENPELLEHFQGGEEFATVDSSGSPTRVEIEAANHTHHKNMT